MNRKILLSSILFCSINLIGQGQLDYSKSPYWISMMEKDGGNYFETIKAFDMFWKNRKMPVMVEEDLMSSGVEKTNKELKKMSKKAVRNRDFNHEMIYQIKRYRKWKEEVHAYVQEDGRILTMDERLKLWSDQKSKNSIDEK